jgi:4a-hydroxytetrahydrobiopterin dehydratase
MALLGDEDIDARLAEREGWERRGDAIVCEVRTADFMGSVELLQRVATVAEEMNHHPDVSISWDRVTFSLTTHSAGGLTENDFALAERIDELS